jgi:hypothetical protein
MDTSLKDMMAAKRIQLLDHPPYSLELALADFFLFRRVRSWRASPCTRTA